MRKSSARCWIVFGSWQEVRREFFHRESDSPQMDGAAPAGGVQSLRKRGKFSSRQSERSPPEAGCGESCHPFQIHAASRCNVMPPHRTQQPCRSHCGYMRSITHTECVPVRCPRSQLTYSRSADRNRRSGAPVPAHYSQAKIRFQSLFMLITVQPLAFASS